jgi:hypothetical protein
MVEKDEDNLNKNCECDDPCDDCTGINMSDLTGWIKSGKKENKDETEK